MPFAWRLITTTNLSELVAIDVHTHAEVSCKQPDDDYRPEFEVAFAKHFKSAHGQLYPALPPLTFIASGHGPRRELVVIPDWDLIVVWNESKLARGDREGTRAAMRWIAQALKPF